MYKTHEDGDHDWPFVALILRPTLHSESRAKVKVQLKSSIPLGAKVEIGPKGFALGVKATLCKALVGGATP
jgi:hypothetical protein